MTNDQMERILANHALWLKGEGVGELADLTDANLIGAKLNRAKLVWANLTRASLNVADLIDADLTDANLTDANLTRANLTRANLIGANFTGANLARADLTDANLNGCIGNMREIKSMQFAKWPVTYTSEVIQIGCQSHPIAMWEKADPRWIAAMDPDATEWWEAFGPIVLATVEASPAKPTGHERTGR